MIIHQETPVALARDYLATTMRYTPLFRAVVLEEFDSMMRGEETPYLDRNEDIRSRIETVLRHFRIMRRYSPLATAIT